VALALETLGRDETLNLRSLGIVLLALAGDCSANDKFPDIILLIEAKKSSDLGSTLRAESLGVDNVREAWKLLFTLLHNAESKNRKVGAGDSYSQAQTSDLTQFIPCILKGNPKIPPRTLFRFLSPVRRGR
jgi:hypothetical protein